MPALPTFTTADSSPFFGSGARLKAHVQDGGSGARALIDFYDTELDANCTFVENASGEYHCLPDRLANSYFDANCAEPAFIGTDSAEAPPRAGMLVVSYWSSCDKMVVPYSLVEEQPVTQLYSWIDGTCYPATVFPDSAWTVQPEPLARFSSSALSAVGDEGEAQAPEFLIPAARRAAHRELRSSQPWPCTLMPTVWRSSARATAAQRRQATCSKKIGPVRGY